MYNIVFYIVKIILFCFKGNDGVVSSLINNVPFNISDQI